MRLNQRHRNFCKYWILNRNGLESYQKAFKNKNRGSCGVLAHKLLAKPEIKEHIAKLEKDKEAQLIELRKNELEKLKLEILTEIELDYFHSQVVRGQIEVEEVVQVKEYIPLQIDNQGKTIEGTGISISSFKKIKRPANIMERQRSAMELYKRKGSYALLKKPVNNFDDAEEAEEIKEAEVMMITFSTGVEKPAPFARK